MKAAPEVEVVATLALLFRTLSSVNPQFFVIQLLVLPGLQGLLHGPVLLQHGLVLLLHWPVLLEPPWAPSQA